ncbi:chemokine-like receptor 1 isoform X2 [Pimephales promelas]|uniref:chemokine-like receptor 1 isoform X2 n=1 Tax=Pimephales promelas TaxID=90988 RepID=UPI0019558F4D|nr:chemokine-like receptor 1 isoform X2 [Pimephales promelas]
MDPLVKQSAQFSHELEGDRAKHKRIYKMSAENSNGTDVDYDYIINILKTVGTNSSSNEYKTQIWMTYFITYCIVLILGVTLNFTVVVISCRKNQSFQEVAIWITALAVTHLVSCTSVVFQLLYAYNNFQWNYGNATCKLSSYILYGSMFFTAAMLSLWSIKSTFSKSRCTQKMKNCNIILISFSWIIAAVLACPSLFSREVQYFQCIDDYDWEDTKTTQEGTRRLKAVVVMRFLLGLLVPALVMFLSCCLTFSHKTCESCRKKAQIICAIKMVYFVCWGPQIFLTMLQATVSGSLGENILKYGLPASTVLAVSHPFTSPLIFLLLGRSFKMKWMDHDPNHIDEREMGPLQRQ